MAAGGDRLAQRDTAAETRWLARSVEALALTTLVVLFFAVPPGAASWVLIANLVVFYTLLIRAIAVPDRILPWLPTYFSVEVLFLAYSFLVFYFPYQLLLFGATDLGVSRFVSNSFVDGSNKAITLTTVGMLAFTIGYRILARATFDGGADADRSTSAGDERKSAASEYFSVMATASSILLAALIVLYLLAGWRSAGEGRYTGTTSGGLGVEGISVAILMFCMIVAALWIYAVAAHLRRPPILVAGLVIATAWSVRLLILGDRNSFLLFALVLVGGYFTFVRRASLAVVAATFGIWLVVYQIVEVLRLSPDWYRSGNLWGLLANSKYFQESAGESSFNVTTIALRATVEVVPDTHEFMDGVLKLVQLSSAIPFSARLFLPSLDPAYTSSAQVLGDILLGSGATWSPGTNVISDAYIDFGVAGVVVILFAVGLVAKAIRNLVARDPHDAHRVVMYLLTMASVAELPRYAIELPIRILFWALIFSVFIGACARRFRARAPASPDRTRGSRTTKRSLTALRR